MLDIQKTIFAVGDKVILRGSTLDKEVSPLRNVLPDGAFGFVTAVENVPPQDVQLASSVQWVSFKAPNGVIHTNISTFWLDKRGAGKSFTHSEKQNAKILAGKLYGAFVWHETAEGAAYWDTVYNNLKKIAGS